MTGKIHNRYKNQTYKKSILYRAANHEQKLIKLRKEVNRLFFNHCFSKKKIARKKKVSMDFVIKWTQSQDQDFIEDSRGWPKGKRRKWTEDTEKAIKEIFHDIQNDPVRFYCGATAVEQEWRKRYPKISPPPLRTIGQLLSDLGLSEKREKGRNKGAARYLCYPEHTIYHRFGGRVTEADFIGMKYIFGRTEPLNFIGFSFKKEPRLRYFQRIPGQTAQEFKKACSHFFKKFEKPDFVKVDNCLATIGSASGRRNISQVMYFLLKTQVIPIFAVPRKPFSQASIEGNNSVFSRKFWNRIQFQSGEEVDEKLEWFNVSSQEYMGYKPPQKVREPKKNFVPRVYFIRQVHEEKETSKAFIDVLNEKIFLPVSYINYFVLAEWNLRYEKLSIYFEKEQKQKLIKTLVFQINQRSKEKYNNL